MTSTDQNQLDRHGNRRTGVSCVLNLAVLMKQLFFA
jgi:hypothetical protein